MTCGTPDLLKLKPHPKACDRVLSLLHLNPAMARHPLVVSVIRLEGKDPHDLPRVAQVADPEQARVRAAIAVPEAAATTRRRSQQRLRPVVLVVQAAIRASRVRRARRTVSRLDCGAQAAMPERQEMPDIGSILCLQ